MTHELQVKEHLRNGALYRPLSEPSLSDAWKRRVFRQFMLRRQLEAAMEERARLSKKLIRIGVPVLCALFASAEYFGWIHPASWFGMLVAGIHHFKVPPVGLKEALIYVAIVNGLTLLVRKRSQLFG